MNNGVFTHDIQCSECGYDLRGNMCSVSCPECGHPFSVPNPPRGWSFTVWRFIVRRYRFIIPVFLVFSLALWVAFARTTETVGYYCEHCARIRQETRRKVFVPFVDVCLIELSTESSIRNPTDAIVLFMDPNNECPHHWIPYWETLSGGIAPPFSIYRIPPYKGQLYDISQSELLRFLNEFPNARERITEHLQDRHGRLDRWIEEEYQLWKEKEQKKDATSIDG